MLNDLRKYENLGTPNYFYQLSKTMSQNESYWSLSNLNELFSNKVIDGRMNFDGCLLFAISIKLIINDNDDNFSLNPIFQDCLVSDKYLQNKLLEQIFIFLSNTPEFHEIFNPIHISYDVIYNKIQITNSAFKFKYANFKQLLIDFSFITPHPDKHFKKYIIEGKYKKLFDKHILPSIKKEMFSIDELRKQIEINNIYGEEAELFVLEFEKRRLFGHKRINKIEKISDYHVNAGYDIVSFDTTESEILNRCIEVKSFSGNKSFFWSRNEIDVAKLKENEYFLYLIDRSKMNNENYIPTIIQNPYKTVLNNDNWKKRIEKYFITT
jgi:hypothetical protein